MGWKSSVGSSGKPPVDGLRDEVCSLQTLFTNLTAETIEIWKFRTIHLPIFDQYAWRWRGLSDILGLTPKPILRAAPASHAYFTREILWIILQYKSTLRVTISMGVGPWVNRGTFPLLFEIRSGGDALCFVSTAFSGVDIFVLMHTVFVRWLEQFSVNLDSRFARKLLKLLPLNVGI